MNRNRKGIVLAGGTGSRLWPLTLVVSKQLLPIYNKPMIYYPITTLMLAGIRDILIISTPYDLPLLEKLLGNGSQWGIKFTYASQPEPGGIAQAFIIGADFIGDHPSVLILGDNIFYGHGFSSILHNAFIQSTGATIFAYKVKNPERYGVISLDDDGNAVSIVEKPCYPLSNFAIPGIYFYDNQVVDIARTLRPSNRGELEITDINIEYMNRGQLCVDVLSRGFVWLDAGTLESLHLAANFVETVENIQGLKIACPEEIAYQNRFIDRDMLQAQVEKFPGPYGKYLIDILHEG